MQASMGSALFTNALCLSWTDLTAETLGTDQVVLRYAKSLYQKQSLQTTRPDIYCVVLEGPQLITVLLNLDCNLDCVRNCDYFLAIHLLQPNLEHGTFSEVSNTEFGRCF